jgi:hypothetical protein
MATAVAVVACGPGSVDGGPVECGEVTRLEPHPQQTSFLGAPLGPLMVRNFADDATTAEVTAYEPGRATKVVIVVARPFSRPLALRGYRCSDGRPLRFASTYPFALNSTPAPSDVFASAGQETFEIQPSEEVAPGLIFGPRGAPPYMLFSSPGKWVIELRDRDDVVGRAALLVR